MSQTSGASGHDPEKDEWLKQFSGIPDSYDPDDLTTDRPYFDHIMQKRADGLTIEGQIEALGDAAAGIKEKYGHDRDERPRGLLRRIFYGLLVAIVLWIAFTHLLVF
jgi:hypothetical protein